MASRTAHGRLIRRDSSAGIAKVLAQISDAASVMIWVAGTDKQIKWVNQQWSRFAGVESDTLLGSNWLDHIHPEDREACIVSYREAYAARTPMHIEYRLRRASGEYRWVSCHAVPSSDGEGEFSGFVGCCTDIQESRSAERRSKHQHQFLERMIDTADQESEAVAGSLHDQVLQPLLAAKMHIESLTGTESVNDRATRNLDLASQLLSSVAEECLQVINRTRPLIIQEQGAQIAIEHLIAELNEQTPTRFELISAGHLGRSPRLWEGSVYWIVAEALQNVVRHAAAQTATVSMNADGRTLAIEVSDDGKGFDSQRVGSEAFGLRAIEERALILGGRFAVESTEGVGTKLTVTIPLPHELDA